MNEVRIYHKEVAHELDGKRIFTHIWIGPFGLHYFHPKPWKAQWDFSARFFRDYWRSRKLRRKNP